MKKLLSPDAVEAQKGGDSAQPASTKVNHRSNIPDKHADLLDVSKTVSGHWNVNPAITLVWKTQIDFDKDVTSYGNELSQRNTSGGFISQRAKTLEDLDHAADDALPYVKTYINGLFGPHDGKSHFAEFGMVHRGHSFELPADRQKRLDALRMMSEAITANHLDANTYGQPFWSDLYGKYGDALNNLTGNKTDVSDHVGNVSQLRNSLRRVLHSLLLVLEGNYPDTYHDVIRSWVFLKENY